MGDEETLEPVFKLSWLRDFVPLISLVVAGLVWGMKLEARYDRLEERTTVLAGRIGALEERLNVGILPIARERIDGLATRITQLEKDCLENRHE